VSTVVPRLQLSQSVPGWSPKSYMLFLASLLACSLLAFLPTDFLSSVVISENQRSFAVSFSLGFSPQNPALKILFHFWKCLLT
jgi:hypothetical protein